MILNKHTCAQIQANFCDLLAYMISAETNDFTFRQSFGRSLWHRLCTARDPYFFVLFLEFHDLVPSQFRALHRLMNRHPVLPAKAYRYDRESQESHCAWTISASIESESSSRIPRTTLLLSLKSKSISSWVPRRKTMYLFARSQCLATVFALQTCLFRRRWLGW